MQHASSWDLHTRRRAVNSWLYWAVSAQMLAFVGEHT